MGTLYLRNIEGQGEWDEYAEARGDVFVPADSNVRLHVGYDAMSDLSPLSSLGGNDLQVLAITSTRKFSGTQLKNIAGLTGLIGLALWETNIKDEDFLHLRRLSSLRWLDIGDAQITDEGLAFVRGLEALEELTLLNTRIGNAGLSHLVGLKKLRRLDLMSTDVDDEAVAALRELTSLVSLRIKDTAITYPAYAELKRTLPACRVTYHEPAQI